MPHIHCYYRGLLGSCISSIDSVTIVFLDHHDSVVISVQSPSQEQHYCHRRDSPLK